MWGDWVACEWGSSGVEWDRACGFLVRLEVHLAWLDLIEWNRIFDVRNVLYIPLQ